VVFIAVFGAILFVPFVISNVLISSILWVLAIPSVVIYASGTIKRLHDVNRSGWWVIAAFVPIAAFILWFVVGQAHGDGLVENSYGYRKKWNPGIPG
jgi:uncharacterized membrane protein YhaH (DUF805 family)